eukprot:UN27639
MENSNGIHNSGYNMSTASNNISTVYQRRIIHPLQDVFTIPRTKHQRSRIIEGQMLVNSDNLKNKEPRNINNL